MGAARNSVFRFAFSSSVGAVPGLDGGIGAIAEGSRGRGAGTSLGLDPTMWTLVDAIGVGVGAGVVETGS